MDDAASRDLMVRLSRPHPSGGRVLERAAILAEGPASAGVVDWIVGRAATANGPRRPQRRSHRRHRRTDGPPLRYILVAGALV